MPNQVFLLVLKDRTAGDPQKADVIWTDLSNDEIRQRLAAQGIGVGKSIVKKLLLSMVIKSVKFNDEKRSKKL